MDLLLEVVGLGKEEKGSPAMEEAGVGGGRRWRRLGWIETGEEEDDALTAGQAAPPLQRTPPVSEPAPYPTG